MSELVNASSVAIFDKGRFLLIERALPPYQGCWTLPGGRLEDGETPEQAARREIREEMGLEVGPLTYIATQTVSDGTFHIAVYLTTGYLGTLTPSEEVADWQFMAANELGNLPTTPGFKDILQLCIDRLTGN